MKLLIFLEGNRATATYVMVLWFQLQVGFNGVGLLERRFLILKPNFFLFIYIYIYIYKNQERERERGREKERERERVEREDRTISLLPDIEFMK